MKLTVILCLILLSSCLCGCSAIFARPTQLTASQNGETNPPEKAVQITAVFPDTPAARAGLKGGDLVAQYGGERVVDEATLYQARSRYQGTQEVVEIVIWRGRVRMTAKIPTGWLGVSTIDNDRVSRQFVSLMERIDFINQVPEYLRDEEFKRQFDGGSEKVLQEAEQLLTRAEIEGTLTPTQIQVDRIFMTADDAPAPTVQRQEQLLTQLSETQPIEYLYWLGQNRFFTKGRFRPAIVCFNSYLAANPDDVSIRLNLALAYNQMKEYERAAKSVRYVFDHHLSISGYGEFVAYRAGALAETGSGNYANSIEMAKKAFALRQDPDLVLLAQLDAAQMNDRRAFDEATEKLAELGREESTPGKIVERKLQQDAVEAYLLVKENKRDEARNLAKIWRGIDQADLKVADFWKLFPTGLDVSKNWTSLIVD